jgi:hypothetical protein
MDQDSRYTNRDLTTDLPNATLSAATVPEFNIFKETNLWNHKNNTYKNLIQNNFLN